MPILGGILLRALGKMASAVWLPVVAVAMAWIVEQVTGAISWGIFEVGFAVLRFILELMDSVAWPAGPDWTAFAGYTSAAIQLLEVSGVLAALTILVTGGVLRVVVKTITLGRI